MPANSTRMPSRMDIGAGSCTRLPGEKMDYWVTGVVLKGPIPLGEEETYCWQIYLIMGPFFYQACFHKSMER